MTYDLVVIGAGPAGLATSIFASQKGLSVAVIEQRQPPLDKACGEGLMPRGTRMLRDMGVRFESGEYVPFFGIRYIDGDVVAEGHFGQEPGWGVRRTALARRMRERAERLGVTLRYGVKAARWRVTSDNHVLVETAHEELRAQFLVGADGLHSKVRRQAELEQSSVGLMRYGARRHFEIEPWSRLVEVHWGDGIEAYVTPVGPKEVGVALLWSGPRAPYERLLERFPRLTSRLSGSSYSSHTRGAGPFRQFVSRRHRGPVALVGDAAGYFDALTGEGLSLSFLSARALAEALSHGGDFRDYERNYRKLSRNYYWMTSLLLQLAQRPRLRTQVFKSLANDPRLFGSLLAIAAGEESIATEGVRSLIRLLLAMMKGFR